MVHSASIRSGAADHYPQEVLDTWVEAFNPENFPKNIQRMDFFVAELADGQIGAFLAMDMETREVDSVYVAPWGQGMGLGSYLLGYGEEAGRLAGLKDLWLDASLNAVSFYAKYGWEEKQHHDRERKGVRIPVVRMEKSLTP